MSRIGKKPVPMPAGVSATTDGGTLTVKGPKGTLAMSMLEDLVRAAWQDAHDQVAQLQAGADPLGGMGGMGGLGGLLGGA